MRTGFPASFTTLQTRWVVAILLASVLLRWGLILQGGQYFFSDEQRYEISRAVAEALVQGKFKEAALNLFLAPEHLGYKTLGIVPALLERVTDTSLAVPAMFFSLFSVFNLFLIFLLSRRMNASPAEALVALTFAALSQSLFYYSRHLLPYDVAMSFGLLSLFIGLSDRDDMKTSFACGFTGWLCFITYNGYWTLAAFAMLVHILRKHQAVGDISRTVFHVSIGFLLPLLALMAVAARLQINLMREYRNFAETISQGNYAEGWSLPFAYFWHTEHFLGILLVILAFYAVLKRQTSKTESVTLWGGGILFVYLCPLIPSVFLHFFVVYGRLARQIMPFLILLSAPGLTGIFREVKYWRGPALPVVLALLVQAGWNFGIVFNLTFPRDFVNEAQTRFNDFYFAPKRFAFGAPELCENNGYVMQNAKFFLDVPKKAPAVPGVVLLSASHPLNFLPYQYEGYTSEQRRDFREAQLEMVFYRLNADFAPGNNPEKNEFSSCLAR